MSYFLLIILLPLTSSVEGQKEFPDNFKFGVSSSAYQIEGAWSEDGKGESIWDHLVHNHPEKIRDRSNGDVACDSYHLWHRDVEMLKELGVDTYRFSIAWTRIMPTGIGNQVNPKGVEYYNSLINALLANNITPYVVLYHWDLPQRLQEMGGWINRDTIGRFKEYARFAFETFGDRVKWWTTFNEPVQICRESYEQDAMAPGYDFPGIPCYLCAHNLLLAHAETVQLYRLHYQSSQGGKIGISLSSAWAQPRSDSADDREASEMNLQFIIGWFAHPIFSTNGNYPQIMIDRIGNFSAQQGFAKSRLPTFSADEIRQIKESSDFLGFNTYTSYMVHKLDEQNANIFPQPSFNHDSGVVEYPNTSWPETASSWFRVHPKGIYNLLTWIRREYDNPDVFVTENGYSDHGDMRDTNRVEYFKKYMDAVLDAVGEGCNVKGYFAWSLMDNFEWRGGIVERFGLYYVDFNHPNRTRTRKSSAKFYADVIKKRKIDMELMPEPDDYTPYSAAEAVSTRVKPVIIAAMIVYLYKLIY
ncbi:myrosinase 1-like [Toxorhynchites rutilus septentrionalis]|uniref:myrosinase 1-like n=1 Tax=Toxorhynchites rutilus septentrionalis TaxID=329112 RepID=UPI002478E3B8|nr:myrosinase 1-like [Toxorhynchites rutilus septentrionalis]